MPSLFVVIIVGILLAYIGYLQLQLYINQRITNAFQDVAVVVPPAKGKPEPSSAMLNLILFLMCVAVFYMMIR